ncbi:MAG: hypothetical protein GXY44_03735 [Phycisphaerales bacterium]|nr:hypothetical protein [Phycisphaerales bacterium]
MRRKLAGLSDHLAMALWEDRLLILITILYVCSGLVVQWFWQIQDLVVIQLYADAMYSITACFMVGFLSWFTIHTMWTCTPGESLYRVLRLRLQQKYLYPRRLLGFLMLFLILPQFMGMFCSYKQNVHVLKPFCWDTTFMRWDYLLHGGHHPWELLQPILGYPLITSIINACYHAWMFVLFGVTFWLGWHENRLARMQYLLCFLLMWILLGTILAIGLSSAGPCYYDRVTGDEGPFLPLMAYLERANQEYPIWSIDVREMLWRNYETGQIERVRGITAMPSMHVASTLLLALGAWSVHRKVGAALFFFALIILIGSVHLAWHYAIDGYLSIVLVLILWKTVGWALRKYSRLSDNPESFRYNS